ncbi:CPBP family intramembrane metalloprotease [Phenylobacterium sp. J426]|uniref:CPBP family intramembrane glutamic endopeptidase n=1 Tax=Phenylobacterium sp. J426 TaxID=2898439 RepID=UPI0021511366|nr:CPBP family intramembrane glutamic endopeptidase [Phenylobacterium sp. J426]MCR5873818.1 CPBP family intramembrane metalloprotease [Phenylobacterium sp. J426]
MADQLRARPPRGAASAAAFFALTALLTVPFWLASARSEVLLLPGLPLAGLAVICPATAAAALCWRAGGPAAVRALLARVWDGRRAPRAWWGPAVLIQPAVALAAFLILRLGGSDLPTPDIAPASMIALFALFLLGGLAEELGWSGYATPRLQARYGPLAAGLIIGLAWALWHYPALLQVGRSLAWIAWWTLGAVAARVVMVWLFNGAGGSVLAVAVFHAMSNLSWQLAPGGATRFDPRLDALLMSGVAAAVTLWAMRRRPRPRPG